MIRPLLLLLPLAACARHVPDPRGVDRDETLLVVTATGRNETRPDEARLTLGVSSRAPTSEAASAANAAKMRRVTDALARLGVKPDDLQTRNLQLQRIGYGPERGQFQAENTVEVRLRDPARAGQAVSAVAAAGANVLSGPDLRVSDREAASRSAYAAAYRAGGGGREPMPVADAAMSVQTAAPEQAAPFSVGLNETEVRVQVSFALAPK
jgi:uncharacterized protein